MADENLDQEPLQPELSESDFSTGGVADDSPAPDSSGQPADPAAQQQPEMTIRGLVNSLGYRLGEDVPDDYAALVHLVQQAGEADRLREQQRQADVYTQLGRQLAPKAQQLGQFLQQQQAPQGRKPYEPPPFDDRWSALLKQEPSTGMYVGVHPNVPQEIINAANEYRAWTERFIRNPLTVMEQFAADRERQLVEERFPQMVEQALQRHQQQQAVQQIASQNAAWFYARDDQGNFIPDPVSGTVRIAPLGQQYLEALRWAQQAGVQDPIMRDQFARRMLHAEIARATAPAEQPTNPQVAAQRQGRVLPQSRPRSNPLQSMTRQQRSETAGATEPDSETRFDFAEAMRRRFREEGVSDEILQAEGAFGT